MQGDRLKYLLYLNTVLCNHCILLLALQVKSVNLYSRILFSNEGYIDTNKKIYESFNGIQ